MQGAGNQYAQFDPILCDPSGCGSETSAARGQSCDGEMHSDFCYWSEPHGRRRSLPPLGATIALAVESDGAYAAAILLDFAQSGLYPIAVRFPDKLEAALLGTSTDMRKSKEIESLRFAKPALSAVERRKASERNQPGLVRV